MLSAFFYPIVYKNIFIYYDLKLKKNYIFILKYLIKYLNLIWKKKFKNIFKYLKIA